MKMNHRHYILIIFAIGSIAVVGFVYFFVYQKIISNAQHYTNANTEVHNEGARKQNEQDLLKVYASTKDARDKLTSYLVRKDDAVGFIEMVEGVGSNSGTKVELSSISNSGDTLKARVDVKGSWSGVMTALTLIENLPVSMTINNLRLDASSDLEKGRYWSLSLDLEALITK